jgi:type II secretory pathway pseudopilin PulG
VLIRDRVSAWRAWVESDAVAAVAAVAAESAESTETAAERLRDRNVCVAQRARTNFSFSRPLGLLHRASRASVPKKFSARWASASTLSRNVPWLFPLIPRIPRQRGSGARGRPGISLLEAVVAIAIVGMTAVSALEAAGGDMRAAERSRRAIEAEALATSRLDFMDLLSDRELQALPDSVEKGKFDPPLDQYSWKTTSTPLSDQAGVYTIHVTVEWPGGSYMLRSYAYRTPPFSTRR